MPCSYAQLFGTSIENSVLFMTRALTLEIDNDNATNITPIATKTIQMGIDSTYILILFIYVRVYYN
jgi:hypothetical protein